MSSIDLSAAFDVVNINLLIDRLRVIGLPGDIVDLIKIWLENRSFCVEVNGLNSLFYDVSSGTIQGSILGPILYAIYVSPLFDLTDLSNFADDNFAITWHSNKQMATLLMQEKLEIMSNWLKQSGLKVNESKTELCLFHCFFFFVFFIQGILYFKVDLMPCPTVLYSSSLSPLWEALPLLGPHVYLRQYHPSLCTPP